MQETLVEKIKCSVREKYGEECPSQIKERVRMELEMANLYHLSYTLLTLQRITRELQEANVQYCIEGTCVNSILLYLLGITFTNPLPVHYYCPQCKKVEFTEATKDGFDLKSKTCSCGGTMDGDGHNLLSMLYWCNPLKPFRGKHPRDHTGRIIFLRIYDMGLFELSEETMRLLDTILNNREKKKKWKIELEYEGGLDLHECSNIYRPISGKEVKKLVVKKLLRKINISEELKDFLKNAGELWVNSMSRYLWWQGVDMQWNQDLWKQIRVLLPDNQAYTWPAFYDDLYELLIKNESPQRTFGLMNLYYRDFPISRQEPSSWGYACIAYENYKTLEKYLPWTMTKVGQEFFSVLYSRGTQLEHSILHARVCRAEKELKEYQQKNRFFSIGTLGFDSTYTLDMVEEELSDNYVAIGPVKNVLGLREELAEFEEKYVIVASEMGILFLIKSNAPGNKELLKNGIRGCHIPQNWINAGHLTYMGEILVGRSYYVKFGNKKVTLAEKEKKHD